MDSSLYNRLIKPRAANEDARRRELIFNILIVGAICLTVAATAASTVSRVVSGHMSDSNSPLVPLVFTLALGFLWYLSRRGLYIIGAHALVVFFFATGTLGILQWSFEIPEGELIYVLTIVMAGVLIGARALVVTTGVVSLSLIFIGYLQARRILHPNTKWLSHPVLLNDVFVYIVTFAVITLIMWLAIKEIQRSLARVRKSEASLEVKVVERTQALERLQRERVLELERFAEFGRVSAGLLHDLANPLTSASLNLAELDGSRHSRAAQQALRSIRHLEQYVAAARKQLQNEGTLKTFRLDAELNQVIRILRHKARLIGVALTLDCAKGLRLYGDPVKFHQLSANLIANAIEAYENSRRQQKEVAIEVHPQGAGMVISVHDHGAGIAQHDLENIFTPFYTNKRSSAQSTGLGLSLVKRIVEQDFNGKIAVSSTPDDGTNFTVRLRNHHRHAR